MKFGIDSYLLSLLWSLLIIAGEAFIVVISFIPPINFFFNILVYDDAKPKYRVMIIIANIFFIIIIFIFRLYAQTIIAFIVFLILAKRKNG